jgi:histidinol-phosphatase (PHP family)
MYLSDYHTHSKKSIDGHNSVMEMCKKAIKKGIKEIAITDHFEPTLRDQNHSFYNAEENLLEISNVRKVLGKHIKIKFGIELGQPHIYLKSSKTIVDNYPFDYVLASAHKMKDDIDFGQLDYSKIDVDYYCRLYLNELKELAKCNLYDCIGHLDLVKRYGAKYGINISLIDYKEELEEILKILINKGKGIKEAVDIAEVAGFKYITLFNNRQAEWIKIGPNKVFYYSKNQLKYA